MPGIDSPEWWQVLSMALEYEGAPLTLERKQEYISRRAAAKAEAPTLPVRILCAGVPPRLIALQ